MTARPNIARVPALPPPPRPVWPQRTPAGLGAVAAASLVLLLALACSPGRPDSPDAGSRSAAPAAAATSESEPPAVELRIAGQWGGWPCCVLAGERDTLVLNVGPRLLVFHVGNPAAPQLVASSDPIVAVDTASAAAVMGDTAFVVGERDVGGQQLERAGALMVFDLPAELTDSASNDRATPDPVPMVSMLTTHSAANAAHINGTTLLLAGPPLEALDVTVPAEPAALIWNRDWHPSLLLPGSTTLTAAGGLAFIGVVPFRAAGSDAYDVPAYVDVMDLAPGQSLRLLGTVDSIRDDVHEPPAVAALPGRLFVGLSDAVWEVDVGDPARPRVAAQVALPAGALGHANTFLTSDPRGYIYVGGQGIGATLIAVLDVRTPGQPRWLTERLPVAGTWWGHQGGHVTQANVRLETSHGPVLATVANGGGQLALHITDITDPGQPTVVGRVPLDTVPAHRVTARDGLVVIEGDPGQLTLLRADEEQRFRLVGALRLADGREAQSLALSPDANTLFVAHRAAYQNTGRLPGRVSVVDVHDPGQPSVIATLVEDDPDATIVALAAPTDQLLAVGSVGVSGVTEPITGSLRLVDVSHPDRPRWLGSLTMATEDIVVVRDRLYAIGACGGDVRGAYKRTIAEGQVYFIVKSSCLAVVDIRDPAQPKALSTTLLNIPVNQDPRLAVMGDHLVVASQYAFAAIDVSDPQRPDLQALPLDFGASDVVALPDGRTVLAVARDGLIAVDLTDFEQPRLGPPLTMPLEGTHDNVVLDGETIFVVGDTSGLWAVERVPPGSDR